jgi:hypothetical protein
LARDAQADAQHAARDASLARADRVSRASRAASNFRAATVRVQSRVAQRNALHGAESATPRHVAPPALARGLQRVSGKADALPCHARKEQKR